MYIENFWLFVVVVFVVGSILGFAFFTLRYRNSRRLKQLQDKLDEKTEELEVYREDVSEHFLRTAELVDNLTQSYKAVYDHLEGGAYQLVGDEKFRKQLEQRKQLQLEDSFSARRDTSSGPANPDTIVVDDGSDDSTPVTKVQAEEVSDDEGGETEAVRSDADAEPVSTGKASSYPRNAPNRKRPSKSR